MPELNNIQIAYLVIEGLLVVAGIVVWFAGSLRTSGPGLEWNAPLTNTLMLAWAVLVGGFFGQIAGASVLKILPEAVRASESFQILVVGVGFDAGCLIAWCAVHAFAKGRGEPLPPATVGPISATRTMREGATVFVRLLPAVLAVGLTWGFLLTNLGLPAEQQDLVGVFARAESPGAIAGLLLLAVVIAPMTEELVFRAGVFRILEGRIGRWPAMAASSCLFALLHFSWLSFAPLFCLGILFCMAYERSRNIAVPMIAHGLFNLNSILMIVTLPPELLQ